MLPAIVIEKPPRLVRAIRLIPGKADPEQAAALADELSGITAMVAEKFTNDRTAEGIGRAQLLTIGGVSLGLEHLLEDETDDAVGDEAAIGLLISEGAELVFQQGFRMIKDLAAMPEDTLVGEFDADPAESWTGWQRYLGQLEQRRQVQAIVRAAQWLRRHHWDGPIKDPDINAEGVIALAIVFGVEGTGRIVARTGQKEFERLVQSVRKKWAGGEPDFESGWTALLEAIPAPHKAVVAERIDMVRNSPLVRHLADKTPLKQLVIELENFAGSELDAEYP
jgi:hypothetical protein